MSKRTRLFVVAALATLAIGIGTAGLASYAGLRPALLGRSTTSDLAFVPGTAQFVAFADVRRVMDSDLRQQLAPSLGTSTATQNPLQQIGLDLERDVDSVIVASLPGGTRPEGMPLLLAHGRFDIGLIEAQVRSAGGSPNNYGGIRMVANDQIAVAFIETGFIAVGDPASVRLALDTKSKGVGSISGDDAVMRLVRKVDASNTWVVANFEDLQAAKSFPVASQGSCRRLPGWPRVATLATDSRRASSPKDAISGRRRTFRKLFVASLRWRGCRRDRKRRCPSCSTRSSSAVRATRSH